MITQNLCFYNNYFIQKQQIRARYIPSFSRFRKYRSLINKYTLSIVKKKQRKHFTIITKTKIGFIIHVIRTGGTNNCRNLMLTM